MTSNFAKSLVLPRKTLREDSIVSDSEIRTGVLLLLLLLLKEVGSARLGESDVHPISPKTPAPQYHPIEYIHRKKIKGKIVEDNTR